MMAIIVLLLASVLLQAIQIYIDSGAIYEHIMHSLLLKREAITCSIYPILMSCELRARSNRDIRIQPGTPKAERIGVAPQTAGQMPVVVFSGGERQVHLRGQRPRPMAAVVLCPSAAVSSRCATVKLTRSPHQEGGGIPPGSGHLKPNSSASLRVEPRAGPTKEAAFCHIL